MRKAALIILAIVGVAAGGWFIYQRVNRANTAQAPNYELVSAVRGDISATVSATGAVLPEREASLTFPSTGTVVKVNVVPGAQVQAGQVLAELDTADLALALRQAEVGLHQAEAQLRQLDQGPSDSDVAAAQAALNSAKTAYQQLLKGVDKDQLASAEAQVKQAFAALEQAQAVYNMVKDMPNVAMLPQSLQLQQATNNYELAQANYRVASKGATAAQIAQAQASVAQAQASFDRLNAKPSEAQRAITQAGVEQAQIAVEQAQRRLTNARIVAPWAGVVTVVNLVVGAPTSLSAPAIGLADISKFHLDVLVDEVDVAGIAEGQTVTIEVDALTDAKLTGTVLRVAPAAQTTATGGVSYKVRIDIDPTDAVLRAGMSATATIISATRTGIVLIPNRAVQLERETGRTFVELLVGGVPQKVEVRLGLRGDQQAEVREGVNEGDQLVIRTRTSLEQLQQTFTGN